MKSNRFYKVFFVITLCFAIVVNHGCVTKRKKNEVSKLGKFYHNLTSKYNGYFNANELYKESIATLRNNKEDNYSKIIEVYDYISVPDPKIVNPALDTAIEKVTTVAALHEKGDWVDDCYLLMAKSQFLKQDYETTKETLEYFEEDFNPTNPYGRNFKKKKLSSKDKRKASEEDRKEKEKERKKAKEEADKIKEQKREEAEKAKEQKKEETQKIREDKQKQREEDRKAKEKERERAKKEREKDRKNRSKTAKSKREAGSVKKDTTAATKVLQEDKSKTISNEKNKIENNKDQKKEIEIPEEETKEETASAKKKKEDIKKEKSAYYEGLMWLVRTYTRLQQYSNAEFLINRIEKTPGVDEDVLDELHAVKAELMIKQGAYDEALIALDQAIQKSGKSNDKARYAFIAAQIHDLKKNYTQSATYYDKAEDKADDFTLKFMSKLGKTKSLAASGGQSPQQTVEKLSKFLKETKYDVFKDQIYFAMGEVVLSYDKNKAIEYFRNSNVFNKNNEGLRTESSYILAQLFMEKKMYGSAKLSFDTTLLAMSKSDSRYISVKNLSINLTSIAKNIQIVEKMDSLLAMGELSNEELQKIAKRRLEAEKQSGKTTQTEAPKSGLINPPKGSSFGGFSNFFAYNTIQVQSGKQAFKNKWGTRKLEDNWRRSSKSYEQNQSGDDPKTENKENEIEDNNAGNITDAEYKRIMADVPLSSFQKEQYRGEYKKALFELGKDYRDKIQEYALSAETLEKLLSKFPNFDKEVEAAYYLFLDYTDLNNSTLANKYKSLLQTKYPTDKYTKIATDPSFMNELLSDGKKLDQYYDQSYELFQKKQYSSVIDRVKVAQDQYGKENKMMGKFALLNAMCIGATQGKEAYIKSLQEVILRFPKSNEETKAKEIMRFLGGDGTAFDNVDVQEVDALYEVEFESRHYLAIILLSYDAEVLDNAKISISDYNKKYHSSQTLQLGEFSLSKEEQTQIIIVRAFKNKDECMKYYESVNKSKDEFISPSIANYEYYPISQRNFRKLTQDKTHKKYRVFFEKNYLNK
ncbi:MAG: hypothetical protein RLZZ546_3163 [Bacteroidota bacterium]|jgi:hypothetical protein